MGLDKFWRSITIFAFSQELWHEDCFTLYVSRVVEFHKTFYNKFLMSTLISVINMETRLLSLIFSTLHVYWFLRFFHPPLIVYCSHVHIFSQKIPPSSFINWGTFAPPPRLFQPPRLLERWVQQTKYLVCIALFSHQILTICWRILREMYF